MSLERYCEQFARLKRAPHRVFLPTTKHKAPHKPFLLLAVMEMVGRGSITHRFISITEELNELTELFTGYWRCLMPAIQISSIAYPFSRLNSEPFWKLVPQSQQLITRAAIESISTVPQLRRLALGALIDEALFLQMTQQHGRTALTESLLQAAFSDEGRRILAEEIAFENQAFQYSLKLDAQAHTRIAEPNQATVLDEAVRDQAFRRVVIKSYEHRCAFCGTRIITEEGHTVVEAAHIKPWSRFKDDAIPNGLALCQICHWAFDEGLMGVDSDYHVLTSPQMATQLNAAGFLMTLSGRPIFRPPDTALWPDPARLKWHRSEVGVGL